MSEMKVKRDDRISIRILAISGSIRASSSNTALLHAATKLAPENVHIDIYGGLAELPHFNPDLDGDTVPASVSDFRNQLRAVDGVLISTPEYAHGVPGVLKNSLDWVVSSGEFVDKPVALINASPRSTYAQASLTETLTVMMARLIAEASITVPLLGRILPDGGIVSDPEISRPLCSAILAFSLAINSHRTV
jgi:chromate reductase, NAD(P)H dehydrogenase (quinone)